MEQAIHTGAYTEKQSFKPYLDTNTDVGKEAYERLIQAFSEMDPWERPWCGIGVKVDLLTVSPRGVTVAVITDLEDVKEGLVHVSQNWREPWHVETVDRQKHQIQRNPCERAERALHDIKDSLRFFLKANEQAAFPCIRCLIIFPDGFDFEGPKDFSMVERDEVVRLNLRKFRDLPEAILQQTLPGRLDPRNYRKWIESCILRSNDDSIVGTWLDPALDTLDTEPPKRQLWQLRRPRHQEIAAEEEVSSSEIRPARPVQVTLKRRQVKLTATAITSILIALFGWRLYGVRPLTSVSYSRAPASVQRSENRPTAIKVIQASNPQNSLPLAENDTRDILPASQTAKPTELRERQVTEKQQPVESERKRAPTDASEDSELKRQKIERQIRNAILLRAINGVTVHFIEDTAYLEGRVETENQRSAADKAARSVPGIKKFRNSIDVRGFPATDD